MTAADSTVTDENTIRIRDDIHNNDIAQVRDRLKANQCPDWQDSQEYSRSRSYFSTQMSIGHTMHAQLVPTRGMPSCDAASLSSSSLQDRRKNIWSAAALLIFSRRSGPNLQIVPLNL